MSKEHRKFWSRMVDNFAKKEFIYNPDKVDLKLVQKLDKLRDRATALAGKECPIHIHVACGKPGDHAEDSYHYPDEEGVCKAADLHFHCDVLPYSMQLLAIMEIGFGGIGFYPSWAPCPGWHLDIRHGKTPLYWVRLNREYVYKPRKMMEVIHDEDDFF